MGSCSSSRVPARVELANADSALAIKGREIQSEAERLDSDVKRAADALTTASDDFDSKKSQAESLTKRITTLQGQLYAAPKAWSYYRARRGFDMAVNALVNTHLPALREPVATSQEGINAAGRSALTARAPATRRTNLGLFRTETAALLTILRDGCSALGSQTERDNCGTSMTAVTDAVAAYDRALSTAVSSPFVLNTTALNELTALRARLRALESGIKSAESTVKKRAAEYQRALRTRNKTIKRLERDRSRLTKIADTERGKLEKVEKEYYVLVQTRLDDLEKNRDRYLNVVYNNESLRDKLRREIELLRDTVDQIDADTTRLHEIVERLEREVELLAEEKSDLENIKANLEKILATKVEDLQKHLVDRIKALDNEKKDLEKQLEELKKKRANLAKGTKTADGPIVYYIPPPLEEIIKDKPRFEKLKDTVEIRERELTQAIEFKGGLQGRLTRQFEKIAREVTASKEAEARVKGLEAERDSLDTELTKAKNKKDP